MAISQTARAADTNTIAPMDTMTFHPPAEKGKLEAVQGRTGPALRFSFENDAKGAFASARLHPNPDWDTAAGFSFRVKGDGSNHLGGLEVIWNDDYGQRYGYAFPINSTEWKKITVPWQDLVPEVGAMTRMLDAHDGNPPSKLTQISFGKWWYWKDYAAHSYTIEDLRLEPVLAVNRRSYRPAGDPLARVRAKLKAGKPVTIVTMGDSLTDTDHWSNRTHNWPAFLKAAIQQQYGSDVTINNPAMGGTELRQNLVVMPRWSIPTPAPDLVTIFFGVNDWTSGMRGAGFYQAQRDAVQRIRRATEGKADVLILTTRPNLPDPDTLAEMAEACRKAAWDENAGLADIYSAFLKVPPPDRQPLYASDNVHLGLAGQQLVARTVLSALAGANQAAH